MLLKRLLQPSHTAITQKLLQSLALASLAVNAFCAPEPEEYDSRYSNWYQVELLIFERIHYKVGEHPELWPHNIDLRYPERLEYLFTPEEWENFINPPLEDSLYDDTPDTALNPEPQSPLDSTPNQLAIAPLPEMEKAFLKLGREHKELTQEAQKLKNRNSYRVLFHEAWRQPMLEKQQSPSLVISGGERFDTHSELEGTIKISVNRYLHIDTDLWKTHYEVNYGQSPGYWPMPPVAPKPTRPETIEDLSNSVQVPPSGNTLSQSGTTFSSSTLYANSTNEADTSMNLDFNTNSSILKNDGYNYYDSINSDTSTQNGLYEFDDLNSYEALTKAPYVVKEIIKLEQKRRMRSNELHYIDHPRLGLLIKITPYEVALPKTEKIPPAVNTESTFTP